MDGWKGMLKADPTDWLLEEENPSVRYYTLRDILGRPGSDPEMLLAKSKIMQRGIVPDILRKQREQDYINSFGRFYTAKYNGLVWQLILLAEAGALAVPQIREQCEYMLDNSQEISDGGFAMNAAMKTGGGRIKEVIPCLTGNMVWALIQFGYLEDLRLQKAICWLAKRMCFNDGIEIEPQIPPYNRYEMCWGKHTCHMGAVKALKAFSAIPPCKRTDEVNDTLGKAVEFLLLHHIYKRSHDLKRTSKPGWLKFGFPLMYQTDLLEILDILTGLGITAAEGRIQDALDIMLSKQDEMGRWKNENTYAADRILVPMPDEQKGMQSKWVTFRALRVLKRAAGI